MTSFRSVAKARQWFGNHERIVLRSVLMGAVLVGFALPLVGGPHAVALATRILIFGLLAMSLNLLVRLGNMVSIGHAGLLGAGAYGLALAQQGWQMDYWSAAAVALLAGVVVSFVFSLTITRAMGVYFVMISVAQGMIFWGVAQRWASITGGETGLRGIRRPEQFATANAYYWYTLIIVVMSLLFIYFFTRSTMALRIRGVRDSPARMAALGYSAPFYRFAVFNVAGLFATVAGILYIGYFQFISPGTIHISTSIEVLLMVILGGVGSFFGPLLGAFTIISARSFVLSYTVRWPIILGTLFILVVLFWREGLAGALRKLVYGTDVHVASEKATLWDDVTPDAMDREEMEPSGETHS